MKPFSDGWQSTSDNEEAPVTERMGILHPGEMGISVAASAQNSGCEVYWVSQGRRGPTRERAMKFRLRDAETLPGLCRQCRIVVSVCPPHAAESLAADVASAGFRGIYVDANAIAPQRTMKIGKMMSDTGITFVDGGIIGSPAWKAGTTCMYLSGPQACEVANCFKAGPLDTKVIGAGVGKASALKMCYAANTKGTVALLAAILATAETLGVREELFEQWRNEDPAFPVQAQKRIQGAAPKAWRWVGEMEEIAKTFSEAGLPGGFHSSAANIYQRLARFKDSNTPPTPEEVLGALTEPGN
jgi:3-hydroxyisobutyrate dehydrogenase-like beta-hydroxyacid dehydrogenase